MSEIKRELDEFELKLQEQKEILLACQKKHSLTSCLECKDVIGCKVRDEYIKAVYNSMNKGHGGGFEF